MNSELSVLVLCDFCPRSYHVNCLEVAFKDLPLGDWACPKCLEKREAMIRKMKNQEERWASLEFLGVVLGIPWGSCTFVSLFIKGQRFSVWFLSCAS